MQETLNDPSAGPERTGYVAIAGKPNVGKSTLLNALLGQKIAAVTYRPQTTRKQQLGILTRSRSQAIFIDTPGIHQAFHLLGERMNAEAAAALEDADLVLILIDAARPPDEDDRRLAAAIAEHAGTVHKLLVFNKIDQASPETLEEHIRDFTGIFPEIDSLRISALRGDHLEDLVAAIFAALPEGPPFFPADQVTDLFEREITADLIREAALLNLRDEVPHSMAVRIDQFKERGDTGAYIEATLFVERDSQVGIVVGAGGEMLKRIGTHARKEVEAMSGRKVHLQLRVKVRKNWRGDPGTLDKFGFSK
ncbi:MAG TPA: GTPase Era [Anaerolineales bacterium]|nr:GTPase Era [Anaerolineales bacterium]